MSETTGPTVRSEVKTRPEEVAVKLERLRELLAQRDLDAVLLSRQWLVSWLTGGLQSAVVRATDPGFVRALVSRDGAYVLTTNIEGTRLAAEDPPEAFGMELVQVPWWSPTPEEWALERFAAGRLGNDGYGPGTSVETELLAARLPLVATEHERMRALGADATAALEVTMRAVEVGTGEREIAAEVARRLELVGIFPSVLLVGADRRRRDFRHPTVDGAAVERDALGVLCVERDGLYVAVSRSVALGEPDPELVARHRIATRIEAELILATRPGRTYEEVLDLGVEAYARLGYPGEWEFHYQGGPIGYGSREALVPPASALPGRPGLEIGVGQACAWNPTVQGAKSEDTFLVHADGPEMVTDSVVGWPQVEHDVDGVAVSRPAILELG